MKLNKSAESIVWILIAIVILSFAMLWIVNVLNYNGDISLDYSKQVDLTILKTNADNIVEKLDLDWINSGEAFYIYKNETSKEYNLFTWATNESYKFIDRLWNNVNLSDFNWDIYVREFIKISNTWEWQDWEDIIEYDKLNRYQALKNYI
jgi:hypothetical protein